MDNKEIEQNLGLVHSVAKRFLGRGAEYEDLVQIGSLGLVKAAKNFDESTGYKFSTYAVPMIMGEIKRYLRDDGAVKISRSVKENAGKIGYANEKLSKELGRAPLISELERETGIPKDDIVTALEAIQPVGSIYETTSDGETYLLDKLASKSDEEEKTINKIFLKELLDSLDNRSRKVILLRYFKEETQQSIANKLGVSQVQVSRIEKKVLETLRSICDKGEL